MQFKGNIVGVLFLLVFSCSISSAPVCGADTLGGEGDLGCGTILTPEDAELIMSQSYLTEPGGFIQACTPAGLSAPVGMPLAVHVVRHSNGSGGLSEARVNQAVDDTNAMYASTGMHFFIDGGIHYINSDIYYDINNNAEADALRNTYNIPARVNVYFVNYALGYCGFSTFSWYTVQGMIIANQCAGTASNPSTVPHEIGHYFDLYHTHETAFCLEYVNGSNCTVCGDQLCDTPADPNLSGKVTAFCVYTGGQVDPNGDPYNPDTHNLMSYSVKTCRDYTSPEQDSKEMCTLANYRPELLVLPDITANNSDGPITVGAGTPVTVKVSLDASGRAGDAAEWWIRAITPFGTYWFTLSSGWVKTTTPTPVGGAANKFLNLSPYTILNNYSLNVSGSYLFAIAVDSNVDGSLDLQYYDKVQITVQ